MDPTSIEIRQGDAECDGDHEEDRRHGQPPETRESSGEGHDDRDLEHHEGDRSAERGPGLDQPVGPRSFREAVAVRPPAEGDREREVDGPENDQDDHADDQAGSDRAQAGVAGELRRAPGEDRERDDRREEREDEVDPDEALVASGFLELLGAEVTPCIEVGEAQIAGHRAPPEQPGGDEPEHRRDHGYRCRAPGHAFASRRHLRHPREPTRTRSGPRGDRRRPPGRGLVPGRSRRLRAATERGDGARPRAAAHLPDRQPRPRRPRPARPGRLRTGRGRGGALDPDRAPRRAPRVSRRASRRRRRSRAPSSSTRARATRSGST